MQADSSNDATPGESQVCPACHGAGTVLMSLCCGRGCATCPGDGMFENVERTKRHECLSNIETRSNPLWHLLYGLRVL